jgi:RNA polymerase sigma-70 factor (ECF subfamily)
MAAEEGSSPLDYATLSSDELVLACLTSGDETAWLEFMRRFHSLIARVVQRVARKWGENSSQVVDDLIQDTYLKLCAERARLLLSLKQVHGDATYGYLKVFTANLVHDHFKASRSAKRGGGRAAASIDDEVGSDSSRDSKSAQTLLDREVLIGQLDDCLQAVSAGPSSERDRKIFWLYYRAGLTASAIAGLPAVGLTTKGVESTILRLTRLVRERACSRGTQTRRDEAKGMQAEESF